MLDSKYPNAIEIAIEHFGHLDYAFNNAGAAEVPSGAADLSEEEWDRVVGVNLKGTWLCMKHQLPYVTESKGAIVNMASIYGLVGTPMGLPAYVASKHGIVGLTKSTALEVAPKGVRVNAICPGSVSGERMKRVIEAKAKSIGISEKELQKDYESMTSLRSFVDKEDIANMVIFLLSDEARRISGQVMTVDGNTERMN